MNDNNSGVLLASGGMDSTVLAYKLAAENIDLNILFLNYGQHCAETELNTLKLVVPHKYKNCITIINISDIYKGSNSRLIKEADLWKDKVTANDLYLPYRNLLFLSIASAFAQTHGIEHVYSAFINSNHAKEIDCSMKFFTELETLLEEYGSAKIHMPFRYMSKTEVAILGLELGAPIAITYSCQVNSKNPCGACPNCIDRLEAMKNLLARESYDIPSK